MSVRIEKSDSAVRVWSPYNVEFVGRARDLGGRWDGQTWAFDPRDEDRVRALCRDVYGDDGVTHNTCTLRYAIGADRATRAPLTLHGRPLARAFGRDTGANLADGVVVLEGGFTSGGSVKNWTTVSKGGTVVLVRDFPRDAAKELVLTDDRFSIEPEVDLTDLREERDRLVARLAEIDSILN